MAKAIALNHFLAEELRFEECCILRALAFEAPDIKLSEDFLNQPLERLLGLDEYDSVV